MDCTDWGLSVDLASHPVGNAGAGDQVALNTQVSGTQSLVGAFSLSVFVDSRDWGAEEEVL